MKWTKLQILGVGALGLVVTLFGINLAGYNLFPSIRLFGKEFTVASCQGTLHCVVADLGSDGTCITLRFPDYYRTSAKEWNFGPFHLLLKYSRDPMEWFEWDHADFGAADESDVRYRSVTIAWFWVLHPLIALLLFSFWSSRSQANAASFPSVMTDSHTP